MSMFKYLCHLLVAVVALILAAAATSADAQGVFHGGVSGYVINTPSASHFFARWA
jgi:hypothetical protein